MQPNEINLILQVIFSSLQSVSTIMTIFQLCSHTGSA